jgi:hypothetical protein
LFNNRSFNGSGIPTTRFGHADREATAELALAMRTTHN